MYRVRHKNHSYMYIYVYTCMNVCMYVCMHVYVTFVSILRSPPHSFSSDTVSIWSPYLAISKGVVCNWIWKYKQNKIIHYSNILHIVSCYAIVDQSICSNSPQE